MNRTYDLYRPQLLIKDSPAWRGAYYRAADVTAHPETPVGTLLAGGKPAATGALIQDIQPARPVRLSAEQQQLVRSRHKNHSLRRVEQPDRHAARKYAGLAVPLAANGTPAAVPVVHTPLMTWLPKKYSEAKGLYTDFSTPLFDAAKVAGPALMVTSIMVLLTLARSVPGAPSSGPSQTARSKSGGTPLVQAQTTAQQASVPAKGDGTNTTATSSAAGPTASHAAAATPATAAAAPILPITTPITTGGLGGSTPTTPVDTSVDPTTPVTDPTSPADPSSGNNPVPTDPVTNILQDQTAPVTDTMATL